MTSTICCLFYGGIYLCLGVFLSIPRLYSSFVAIYEIFWVETMKTFEMLLVIVLPINSPVHPAVFWITFFEAVLRESEKDCLSWS